jgi:S1-C subfamily serine protease
MYNNEIPHKLICMRIKINKFAFSAKSLFLNLLLTGILTVCFLFLTFPFLEKTEELSLRQTIFIGQANLWRVVFFFGFFTSITIFFTLLKNKFRLTALLLVLMWIIGTSLVFIISNANSQSNQTSNLSQTDIVNPSKCNEQETLIKAKNCTLLVLADDWYGSGFSIEPGYIITNRHVIENASEIISWVNDEEISLILWGYSEEADLAVMKIPTEIPTCNWTNTENIPLADTLYAVGWPNVPEGESSITKGVYSRSIESLEGPVFIQTDAAINPGNSGGPLVSKCGVVGINTVKLVWSDLYTPSEGFGFALSSNYSRPIIDELIEQGSQQILPIKESKPIKYTPKEVVEEEKTDIQLEPQENYDSGYVSWTNFPCQNPVEIINIVGVDKLGSGKVRVNWSPLSRTQRGYHLHYGFQAGPFNFSTAAGNATSYEIGGLQSGSKYYFAVSSNWYEGPKSVCAISKAMSVVVD